ncbi:hypothetical protein SAMN05892883_2813 [Jatrophihabitans sp. GAS493]|jgi:hypothetical protein|uniref:hypothetical protein n=1 Tax=Jatrophihabitans sp. GAS493 TaxID=1907575 RepID=UPI000BB8673B|nr:hypothetical protein [Jatrophihabitans sp. GAS493]SOD73522.1 hypothetical protein SAMN05892883_2813 [Jatrophihabitans sp. GAS493]
MGALSASELAPKAAAQEHLPIRFGDDTRLFAWIALGVAMLVGGLYGYLTFHPWYASPGAGWVSRYSHNFITWWGHPMPAFLVAAGAVGVMLVLCVATQGFREGPAWTHAVTPAGGVLCSVALVPPALVVAAYIAFGLLCAAFACFIMWVIFASMSG